MKTFNNIEEMEKFYDKERNLFFIEDDIDIRFDLQCAWDINARNITARDIKYYAVCVAYKNIKCSSISGIRENCKHFVLDGGVYERQNRIV